MQSNPKNFSPEDAIKLAKTPEGQQLIEMLKKTNTAAIQNAMKQASAGNMDKVRQTLESLLNTPEIQKLLHQLGEK